MVIEFALRPELEAAVAMHRRAGILEQAGDHAEAAALRARADELLDDRTPEVPILDEPTPKQAFRATLTILGCYLIVVGVGALMIAAHL